MTAIDAIKKGYTAIKQDGVLFKIIAGNGNTLFLQDVITNKKSSIPIGEVQEFITI